MNMKKKAKKTRTEAEYQDLRKKMLVLAKCAILTLDTRGKIGIGSGMLFNRETRKTSYWAIPYFDALDAIGIVYDREKYMAPRKRA